MNPNTITTFDDYQDAAQETAIYDSKYAIVYPALGLGEVGEVQGKIKKILRDDDGVVTADKRAAIESELGDVLWYLAALCRDLDLRLVDVAQRNLHKLYDRAERGVLQGSGDNR